MVQITVPKKLEKQFRPLLAQGQGSIHIFTDLSAIDIKQRTYIYHHQKYMLQFQPTSKVHRLESQRDDIATYAFNFCPFDQLSSKDITSKPLLGIFMFRLNFSYKNIMSYTDSLQI
jgi:replication factor A1